MKYKIQVRKGRKGFYWKILSLNGRTLAHSETYTRREKAKQTALNLFRRIRGCVYEDIS